MERGTDRKWDTNPAQFGDIHEFIVFSKDALLNLNLEMLVPKCDARTFTFLLFKHMKGDMKFIQKFVQRVIAP